MWHVVCVVTNYGVIVLKITDQFQHLFFRPLNWAREKAGHSRVFEMSSNDFQAQRNLCAAAAYQRRGLYILCTRPNLPPSVGRVPSDGCLQNLKGLKANKNWCEGEREKTGLQRMNYEIIDLSYF